jgi:uncharacterized membrane protein SpoIIM required for sporulation
MARTLEEFLLARRGRWRRLEELLEAFESKRRSTLDGQAVLELGCLYREVSTDLARIQTFLRTTGEDSEFLEAYLNHLVGRAHGLIYRGQVPLWTSLWDFLWIQIPKTFRRGLPWTMGALTLFVVGFLYGWFHTLNDETFPPLLVPSDILRTVEKGEVWFDSILAVRPLATSLIMKNNVSVTFLAFALGVTFGLGTAYILLFNGLLVGTLAGLCHLHGLDIPFWSFILPHGLVELTAVFMAGGGGLLLGSAFLFPGDLPRGQALVLRGRRAVRLTLGCVPLLLVAAVVEGFVSPSHLAPGFKFFFAACLLILVLSYMWAGGPRSPRTLAPSAMERSV